MEIDSCTGGGGDSKWIDPPLSLLILFLQLLALSYFVKPEVTQPHCSLPKNRIIDYLPPWRNIKFK